MSKQKIKIEETAKTDGCCCAVKEKVDSDTTERTLQSNDLPLHKLAVVGATCGGCVKKIEQALKSVAGVDDASMNLFAGIAIVSGDVAMSTLIRALEAVGFSATKVE